MSNKYTIADEYIIADEYMIADEYNPLTGGPEPANNESRTLALIMEELHIDEGKTDN